MNAGTSDETTSYAQLEAASARLDCSLRLLPGGHYRIARSGLGRTLSLHELIAFLRTVSPA